MTRRVNDANFVETLPYTLPFIIGALTLVFNGVTSKRSDINARLESQRADFTAIIEPVREELSTYRSLYDTLKKKVDGLEDRLDREVADKRLLTYDVARLAAHVNAHAPGHPIALHPRVATIVDKAREEGDL